MKWQKYTWEYGDPITTQKLNHIEYGIDRVESSSTSKAGARSLMVREMYDPEFNYNYLNIEPDKLVQAIKSGVNVMLVPLGPLGSSIDLMVMNSFQDSSETGDFDSESLSDFHGYSAHIIFDNQMSFHYEIKGGIPMYPKFFSESGEAF